MLVGLEVWGSEFGAHFSTKTELLSSLSPPQVLDRDFPLHVVKPGHWLSYLPVCGWGSVVSVGWCDSGVGIES